MVAGRDLDVERHGHLVSRRGTRLDGRELERTVVWSGHAKPTRARFAHKVCACRASPHARAWHHSVGPVHRPCHIAAHACVEPRLAARTRRAGERKQKRRPKKECTVSLHLYLTFLRPLRSLCSSSLRWRSRAASSRRCWAVRPTSEKERSAPTSIGRV